ncbi:MAG: response regulator transcription factor [Ardenticatenaceae bacterium]|nr:response regulator transcription factor [Ardenticatenaceae bacterium]
MSTISFTDPNRIQCGSDEGHSKVEKNTRFSKVSIFVISDCAPARWGFNAVLEQATGLLLLGIEKDLASAHEKLTFFNPDIIVVHLTQATNLLRWQTAESLAQTHKLVNILVCLPLNSVETATFSHNLPRIHTVVCDDQPQHLVNLLQTAVFQPPPEEPQSKKANLTKREWEVLRLIAMGEPNRQIAQMLEISVKTVESHRSNMLNKLELQSTADLVKYAILHGVIQFK